MQNSFPLLRLPSTVLTNTLKSMEKLDLFSISFVSERTKALVVALNLSNVHSVLMASGRFSFKLMFDSNVVMFVLCEEHDRIAALIQMADPVEAILRGTNYWRKKGYGVRDWIDHIMVITHTSTIDCISFSGQAESIKFTTIRHTIQGLDIRSLSTSECSADYQQAVLEAFPMRNISISRIPYPNPKPIHSIFMQAHDSIRIILSTELKLNEFLTINSRTIEIFSLGIDIGQLLNPFLKLWRKGSSPRLEYLHFNNAFDTVDVNVILKGIKRQVVSNEVVRYFKLSDGSRTLEVPGGFDIRGSDGRRATVCIIPHICEVFVWPL